MVDANILIAGTGWPRFPYEVLQHALQGDFDLVLPPVVIEEARRHIQRLMPELSARFDAFLSESGYESATSPTPEEVQRHASLVRDPKDVPVALAAISAQVDFLITQDRDFTDRDETTEELHRRLSIILPGAFLREYMGWTSEELALVQRRTWQDLSR